MNVYCCHVYLSYVCGHGSNQLMKVEDVMGWSGNKGGSSVNNRLATIRTERPDTLYSHTVRESTYDLIHGHRRSHLLPSSGSSRCQQSPRTTAVDTC